VRCVLSDFRVRYVLVGLVCELWSGGFRFCGWAFGSSGFVVYGILLVFGIW